MYRAGLQALCKRHGLSAGGSNADLIARLDAVLSSAAGAEEEVARLPARKGCLKHEAKKVTFAAEEVTVRRLRSRVICRPVVAKTMAKSAQAITDYAAQDGVFVEVGADVPVRRSRRNSLVADVPVRQPRRNSLGADLPVTRSKRNSLGCDVPVRRSKRNSLGADALERRSRRNSLSAAEAKEGVAVSAQVGVPSRATRKSSLVGAAAVFPPAIEKKRGREKAADGNIVEAQDCEHDVQKVAQVEVSARIKRSRTTAPVVMSPNVVENKRKRKTGDAQTNVELPTVLDVPRNDAPITRSLRNRVVQVNNSVVDTNKPATKGPARGLRQKSVVSELHEKEKDVEKQLIVKQPVRRSSRNYVLADMLENNIQSGKSQDNEKGQKLKESIRRSRRSVGTVLLEEQNSGLHEEQLPKIPMRRSTRKSVALNAVEKVSMDHTEIVVQSTASKGRSSKRRRTIAPEEMMSVKEANDDTIIREATTDTDKATHEYNKSSSRIREEQSPVSGEGRVGLEANGIESGEKNLAGIMSTVLYVKSLQYDIDIVAEETGKDIMPMAFTIEEHREIDGEKEPSAHATPGFYVGSDCLKDEDVQPTGCDTAKKLDVDQGVTEEEVLAQEKCNDQHVPAKTDLKMKLNVELVGGMESGCSINEKNKRLVPDILDQQAIILVQQGDLQEGDLEKPSLCSATPECKHECDFPEETVLPSRNMGSLPSAEQSPFGLESVGYGALASAIAHTENGFDDSKGCHVKSALENTHVSEHFLPHDTEECISKNDDCMHTSQQDNRMAGSPKANLDEERVLSVFSLDAKHTEEVINSQEVACEGEGSKKLVHSEDLKASSEKTDVSGPGIGNPSLSLATPDCKNGEGSTEKSDLQDNLAFPSAKSGIDEPVVCHVEELVDTHVSSEPDTYQRPCEDLSRHEEKESRMSVPMQVKESGGFLRSSHMKGSVTSAQIDLADNAHLIERRSLYHMDIVAAKEVLCEEKEERKSMPTSDNDILHEKSYSNGYDEQLKPELDEDEVEKHSLNCETYTSRILGTGSVMSNTALLHEDGHTICCEELELSNGLSLFKFAEESAICQYVSISGSGPCQQRVNESTSMHATYNIEMLNQCHEYNQNNEDQTTPGIPASSVPEAVEIEQSEMEIGLIPAAEASVLPVPDEQLNNKLEGNEVDEHSCSYDTELLNREASNFHKYDCMDLHSEDNHRNDLPAPRSPQQSAYFQKDNDLGSVGICQSSRRGGGIDELHAKRQSFKVSSTIKGRYIAKSVPRLKPRDSLSQSAIALRRNGKNTSAVKAGHPVKPNADRSVAKDSSRRGLQPISRGPRDNPSQSAIAQNIKNTTAVKSKANKPWL